MPDTKSRVFEAFDAEGADAHTAAEWAESLGTKKSYIYQLRGEWRDSQETAEETVSDAAEHEDVESPPEETEREESDMSGSQSMDESPEAAEASEVTTDTATSQDADDSLNGLQADRGTSFPAPRDEVPAAQESTDPIQSAPSADPDPDPVDAEAPTEAPAETDGGTAVSVGHEGREKLSPAGFTDESTSSIPLPDGVDLPADVTPDDFEPSETEAPTEGPAEAVESTPDSERSESESDSGSGGLLSRIRGDRGTDEAPSETAAEVVESAPNDAERDRREQMLGALQDATTGPTVAPTEADTDPVDGEAPTTSTNAGLVMDEDLMASLFGLPFAQAANATGWDGWELSDEERETNARLLVAYAEEQDIDLSAGGMLAMSLMSTVGGRVAGYAKHRQSEAPDADGEHVEADAPSADPDPDPVETETATETADPVTDTATEAPSTDSDTFDFNDASTW